MLTGIGGQHDFIDGRVSSAAAKALVRANIPLRAVVRDLEKVALGPGAAEIVRGDLNGSAIVERALQGVSRLLIVMDNHPEQLKLELQFASLAADAPARLPKNH